MPANFSFFNISKMCKRKPVQEHNVTQSIPNNFNRPKFLELILQDLQTFYPIVPDVIINKLSITKDCEASVEN